MHTSGPHLGRMGRLSVRIATVSVAVSVVVMILSIAIVRGFKSEIYRKATGFSGEVVLEAPGAGFITDNVPVSTRLSYLQALGEAPFVRSLSPYATASGLIKTQEAIHGIQLKGVDASYRWDFFREALVEGRLPQIDSAALSEEVLVSQRLARKLFLKPGDRLLLYFIGDHVRVRRLTVSGLYNAQLEDIDNHLIIGDLRHVQRINEWEAHEVGGIELTLDPALTLDRGAWEVEEFIMQHSTDEDPGVVVSSVARKYANLFDWLKLLDLNVWILLALMVLVAGFNMVSSLLIMLFEKTSMIGILKALGMRNGGIARVFMYNAAVIVGRGMLWGTSVALVLCAVQRFTRVFRLDPANYFVDSVPIRLSLWNVLAVDGGAFLGILLLLLAPLYFINKLNPAQTIRMK